MDKADDMDGRNASKWSLHLTCLLVHLDFGELMHPEQTLGGKKPLPRTTKVIPTMKKIRRIWRPLETLESPKSEG
jgi:hypothetical protein